MAKLLDEDIEPRRRGPKAKYPWAEWLNGRTWLLTPGEDFTVSVPTMRSMIYQQAYKIGLKVVTELHGPLGDECIRLRTYSPTTEETA